MDLVIRNQMINMDNGIHRIGTSVIDSISLEMDDDGDLFLGE
ncbi:MAG: hypothetical protein ACTSQE_08335 [Candidatus Heimdallarchaeaceae archaeon]